MGPTETQKTMTDQEKAIVRWTRQFHAKRDALARGDAAAAAEADARMARHFEAYMGAPDDAGAAVAALRKLGGGAP